MQKRVICSLCLTALMLQTAFASYIVEATTEPQARENPGADRQATIAVTNERGIDRSSETIALDWKALVARLPGLKPDYVIVRDQATGRPLVTQAIDNDGDGQIDELIFQTDFAARETAKVFIIEAAKERVPSAVSKVFARYVPERDDDFAWENDRIAFRMYGKALEPRLVSSGIDVWAKRTRDLIIDKWFKLGEDWYHKDNGEGLDMYSVKLSRGCGGSGIWDGKRLHVSRNYKSWKVLANGPIRAVFELTYEPWNANGLTVSEVKRITLDAGRNLSRIESTLKFKGASAIDFAIGIVRHKNWTGANDYSKENGWFSRWEDTGGNGSLGCAVVIDPERIKGLADDRAPVPADEDLNHLVITEARSGKPVVYYAGAGWDRSGDFADKKAWNRYLDNFAARLHSPVKISFLNKAAKESSARSWSKRVTDSVLAFYPDPKDLNLRSWDYHNGFFLSGLFRLWQRDKDPAHLRYIKDWLDLYIDGEGAFREEALHGKERQLDDILPGRLFISLYRVTKDEKYRKAAYHLTEQLKQQPRTGEGGYWHKQVYAHQMWLDGIYMAGPYSVEFAHAFDEPRLFDEAARQIALIHKHTYDPETGLLYHGWDESKTQVWANPQTGASPEFWGRAIGWYSMALVDVLDYMPRNHPERGELIRRLQSLAANLLKYQDRRTGLWYQVIDKGERADNWHETSATAMFAYALAKGARKSYLGSEYAKAARLAYEGLLDRHVYLGDYGRFYFTGTVWIGTLNPKVSKGDYASYINTARQVNDSKGVAAFLWASLEMEEMTAQ